ncbi:MAG: hypothetical protein AVDCRST_MAG49-4388 [uncultured Thermomicrobiales bacterium]|uniref:Uncharacterized protein n=1 Tax=uncultured Thermomicrobiales bacterium TaxID=1645740 RepID=A0A6J4VEW7_9BACT|nr:MAG: hypothetical protein AVDCRST_MAG49-4388 [uncultured Thermomicrobiales bacterium]
MVAAVAAAWAPPSPWSDTPPRARPPPGLPTAHLAPEGRARTPRGPPTVSRR